MKCRWCNTRIASKNRYGWCHKCRWWLEIDLRNICYYVYEPKTIDPKAVEARKAKWKSVYYPRYKASIIAKNKEYRKKNYSKWIAYLKKWKKSNPEKVDRYVKKWRDNNPEKVNAYRKKSPKPKQYIFKLTKEQRNKRWRENYYPRYREKIIAKATAWNHANLDKVRIASTKYRNKRKLLNQQKQAIPLITVSLLSKGIGR